MMRVEKEKEIRLIEDMNYKLSIMSHFLTNTHLQPISA